MRLKSKICAITGAGSGIGRAAAQVFAAEGANVLVLERNPDAGQAAADEIRQAGGLADFIAIDIADPFAVQQVFAGIDQRYGRLDVLYNNASIYLGGKDASVSELAIEVWQTVININLNGLFYCCKYALPLMKVQGRGSIINTASSAGTIGIPNCDAYTASKGATVQLTKSMAVEYGRYGIRVNCIAPAAIATPIIKQSNPDNDLFDEQAFLKLRSPLRRYGTPEEVANLALFLASDESSYINGTVIAVDGGITINGDLAKVKRDR